MFLNGVLNSMKRSLIIFLVIFVSTINFSQSITAKREYRAAWLATVVNLDWPSSPNLTPTEQRNSLIEILDKLEKTNINTVIFQVRPESDAFYNSPIEPWSYWLTGKQGKAPEPFYDPLEFAVQEAHKRGLELQAWFNPYRAVRDVNSYQQAANHVSILHPDWIIQIDKIKFLNPGLPQVRSYVTSVIMDVVRRYDIDGVHFDDYFYPYPPNNITNQDSQTFADYPRGFSNIDDWRRDNVNELIRMVYDSIQVVKPYVKFGISPFGIWKNGVPQGISGLDAYSTIYADGVTWLNEQKIDYIAPQLYWPFGGGQDYGKLLPWWASKTNGRFLMPGQALYRAGSWSPGEIPKQIRLNRATNNCYGSIFFRTGNVFGNPNGVTDSLVNNYYRYKSLIPSMNWKDQVKPNSPNNLEYAALQYERGDGLRWNIPNIASDGDTAFMYVIYQFAGASVTESDLNNPANIMKIVNANQYKLNSADMDLDKLNFVITALDRNYNESIMSNVLSITPISPNVPQLVFPENNANNQKDTLVLLWDNSLHSSSNHLQISIDSNFSNIVLNENNIIDTFKVVTNLEGQTKYYWRVSAKNIFDESNFSDIHSFSTGFPVTPLLNLPKDQTFDVPIQPEFVWYSIDSTDGYQFQLAEGLDVNPNLIVIDTTLVDTSFIPFKLKEDKIYSWHVRAHNNFGFSQWSAISKFKTTKLVAVTDDLGIPVEYKLEQNYPNPFNPATNIKFTIPKPGNTSLKIYDILGRIVSVLLDDNLSAGSYSIIFNGSNLPSGFYIYVLRSREIILIKKMLLLK